ncbi:MAG: CoA transferase, partial [Pseudomonadota bacterium]
LSGAFAARLFGDFGAQVWLAETQDGHTLRHEPPFLDNNPGADNSTVHAYVNWNKQSYVYAEPGELSDLLARADVVVTEPQQRKQIEAHLRDDAVLLFLSAFGAAHPGAEADGNNLTACARVGWSWMNRHRDEAPLALPRHQAGYVGGVAGYIAASAALLRRDASEVTEVVDVSEVEALALTAHPWAIMSIYEGQGFANGPAGARPRGEPGPLWPAGDGRMHLAIADFHHWTAAMEAVGLPELGAQADLIPDIGRHSKDLRPVSQGLARTLPERDPWQVFHDLAQLRCVVGVMQNVAQLPDNPQYIARDYIESTQLGDRTVRCAGAPAKLHPAPWRIRSPAPAIGASSEPTSEPLPRAAYNPSPDVGSGEGPLSGVRVLSFGQAWSGTFGSEIFALLGADVVQLGALHRTDVWRRVRDKVPNAIVDSGRTQHALNTQGLYNSVNLNKRELTLDLRHERGQQLMWDLIPRFDIIIDNFRANVMPRWGITLEKLHELRPGMIWASISGYGSAGPYSDYPANGATTEPMSGLSSIHGYAGDAGMNTGGLFPDPMSGYFMAATVMAALHHRDATGEAQRIDLAMMEALSTLVGDAIIAHDATGDLPQPMGNHHPRHAPHNNYPCADDEWLALAVENEDAWTALKTVIDLPALHDERFANAQARKANEGELDELLSAYTSSRPVTALAAGLTAAGVMAVRVSKYYELYADPDTEFVTSGFVQAIDHPEAGNTWLPGRPWRFSAGAQPPLRPAPCVGEHSREILQSELGMSDAAYEELVRAGITGTLADA